MRTQLAEFGIEWSVKQIKSQLREGHAVHADRQSGKTTALFEYVHELTQSNAVPVIGFLSPNYNMSRCVEGLYRVRYQEKIDRGYGYVSPRFTRVLFCAAHDHLKLNGLTSTVVVDEWWILGDQTRRELLQGELRIIAAVGTIPAYAQVPLY